MARKAKATFILTKNLPKVHATHPAWRVEYRKAADNIADRVTKFLEDFVGNWSDKSKPTFLTRVVVTVVSFTIRIVAKEKNKKTPIFKWVAITGTRPHQIRPRPSNKRGLLFFQAGEYSPKTNLGPLRYGGPGKVVNPQLAVAKSVNHPGFRPRKAIDHAKKEANKVAEKEIKNAGKRVLKRKR